MRGGIKMNGGRFIVFEGPDGTGKDTIMSKLRTDLEFKNRGIVFVKDPSPEVAGQIREILLNDNGLENTTRLFLFLAARSELLYKEILPALQEGKTVFCNRYVLSTYCYQGLYFSRQEIDLVSRIGKLDIVKPDLQIVYLSQKSFKDNSVENVMDEYCNNYRQRILERYLECAQDPFLNIRLIWVDDRTIDQVYAQTKEYLRQAMFI